MAIKAYRTGKTTRLRRTDPYTKDWSDRARKIKQQELCCQKCGATTNLEVHHIIPLSKGGSNQRINLITLCHTCHKKQPRHKHLQ